MKKGKIKILARHIPGPRGLRNLDVVHHGKVPAYSLVSAYYTRNRLSSHRKIVLEMYKSFWGGFCCKAFIHRPYFALER
jgi:hypothetical protein